MLFFFFFFHRHEEEEKVTNICLVKYFHAYPYLPGGQYFSIFLPCFLMCKVASLLSLFFKDFFLPDYGELIFIDAIEGWKASPLRFLIYIHEDGYSSFLRWQVSGRQAWIVQFTITLLFNSVLRASCLYITNFLSWLANFYETYIFTKTPWITFYCYCSKNFIYHKVLLNLGFGVLSLTGGDVASPLDTQTDLQK